MRRILYTVKIVTPPIYTLNVVEITWTGETLIQFDPPKFAEVTAFFATVHYDGHWMHPIVYETKLYDNDNDAAADAKRWIAEHPDGPSS
jgi:hypothetical protein